MLHGFRCFLAQLFKKAAPELQFTRRFGSCRGDAPPNPFPFPGAAKMMTASLGRLSAQEVNEICWPEDAQQSLAEHKRLLVLVEGLRDTLAWQVQGADFTRKLAALRFIAKSFERHLERVLALEEDGGYLDLVLQANPQQGNSVNALRKEHLRLRKDAGHIVHQIEYVPPTDAGSFARICGEMVELLKSLDAHNKKEAKLVHKAIHQDEGGEG
jgi:Hemerythrin HHE cation binding domain